LLLSEVLDEPPFAGAAELALLVLDEPPDCDAVLLLEWEVAEEPPLLELELPPTSDDEPPELPDTTAVPSLPQPQSRTRLIPAMKLVRMGDSSWYSDVTCRLGRRMITECLQKQRRHTSACRL
jgi:hypothetical protein